MKFPAALLFSRSALLLLFCYALSNSASAQTFQVIHGFTGSADGANPVATLTLDAGGNIFGTTASGGNFAGPNCGGIGGCGIAFKMTQKNSAWVLNPLYNFTGGMDGAGPEGPLTFGPEGSLYGSASGGCVSGGCPDNYFPGCGAVFKLRPSASFCRTVLCLWTETTLYGFTDLSDGSSPSSALSFDSAGNIYGTTYSGGLASNNPCGNGFRGCGIVYQLTPNGPGWQKTAIHSFTGEDDGGAPIAGVVLDSAGNLYGTTEVGGSNNRGVVYQLSKEGSGWAETVLYAFRAEEDGGYPTAGLVADAAGNFYGATQSGGTDGGGTIFKLTKTGGSWIYEVLYSLPGAQGGGPYSSLTLDHAGNLFGTTLAGGAYQCGNVFKLARSGGGWSYLNLHEFTCGADGGAPYGGVSLDQNGNLFGTTVWYGPSGQVYCGSDTGPAGCGVVWKITP
jgi:uncharacterized repeat protein (TIGR03803 family)